MSSLLPNGISLNRRGAKQLGDEIALGCYTLNASGIPAAPTAAPTMKVYDSAGAVILSMAIPLHGEGRNTSLFGYRLFLSSAFSAGRYFVFYTWTISAVNGVATDYFDVLPGGSSAGHVISAHWLAQPGANYVIYQTSDGAIRKGTNPRVS